MEMTAERREGGAGVAIGDVLLLLIERSTAIEVGVGRGNTQLRMEKGEIPGGAGNIDTASRDITVAHVGKNMETTRRTTQSGKNVRKGRSMVTTEVLLGNLHPEADIRASLESAKYDSSDPCDLIRPCICNLMALSVFFRRRVHSLDTTSIRRLFGHVERRPRLDRDEPHDNPVFTILRCGFVES